MQCSSTSPPSTTSTASTPIHSNAGQQWWEKHSVRGSLGSRLKLKSCWTSIWGAEKKESWGSRILVGGHILEAVGWEGILQWSGEASPTAHTPPHIPLKSKCRGTSPGRSGGVAQCLSRQAVTALGWSPARLHGPLLAQAHPVWTGLTGVRRPTPSGQSGALFL